MRTPYFSRDERYKTPFGAAPAGQAVSFRLFLPNDCGEALLWLWREGEPPAPHDFWRTEKSEAEGWWWECIVTPEQPGLWFYRFSFVSPFGANALTAGAGGAAALNDPAGEPYRLTVYHPAFTTPGWLKGGVLYQIFPDRFCASGEPKTGVPADRYLHPSFTEGQPAYTQTAAPRRLNNDYWGGDLKGVERRLPELADLGVTALYLNPIFEAHSNHRYNTADYTRIDPLLGSESDFRSLCAAAHALGMRVILDGVFSHTGSDSVYFNAEGRYPPEGAANRQDSPYAGWYTFTAYPTDYRAWWGIKTLPEVNETNPAYLRFITGPQGVARRWLAAGADGWRLDVADELPDEFLTAFRAAVKAEKPDSLVLGEVWEDAVTKESYGHRRSYLLGQQLDSVMNYPLMRAILSFIKEGGGHALLELAMSQAEHYPPPALHTLMNHLGTHDTERLITALSGEPAAGRGRAWQAGQRLTPAQRRRGEALVRLASALQYTLPGVPCVYYGDERGMEGYGDPFNRAPMRWQNPPSPALVPWYRTLGRLRRTLPVLAGGRLLPVAAAQDLVAFRRVSSEQPGQPGLLVAVNRGETSLTLPLPQGVAYAPPLLGAVAAGQLQLPPRSVALVPERENRKKREKREKRKK